MHMAGDSTCVPLEHQGLAGGDTLVAGVAICRSGSNRECQVMEGVDLMAAAHARSYPSFFCLFTPALGPMSSI